MKTTDTKKITEAVGARIKEIRSLKGMSQEALGKFCGITFQQIQKYEKGTNRVSAARLVQMAQAFDVDVCVFFAGFRHETAEDPIAGLGEIIAENRALKERLQEIRRITNNI
jgi:transcriptional regulator with XRE-family HTH domain